MNLVELDRALRQLRLSGMADVLEARRPNALHGVISRRAWPIR